MREEKTEVKKDPRKNDIIKLRVRVQGQASSGEKTCPQYYYDTGQYVCPHGLPIAVIRSQDQKQFGKERIPLVLCTSTPVLH